ncbi:MAG: hypothetical protein HOQ30_09690 [Gemmatimonadaceae bacterium]|nr:hypothetical protein [Gemmatimonadaceae bacterium]
MVELTTQETAVLATGFARLVEGDNVAGELSTVQNPPPPDTNASVSPFTGTHHPTLKQKRRKANAPAILFRPAVRSTGDDDRHSGPGRRRATSPLMRTSFTDCTDIARSIYYETPKWRSARQAYTDALNDLTTKIVPEVDESGNWHLRLPSADDVLAVDQAGAEAKSKELELDYLAMQYSSFGCWNNTSWDSVHAFTGSSGSSVALSCHTEPWQISTDGGQTWTDIDADVCEYAMA